jgi:hypothetical protein
MLGIMITVFFEGSAAGGVPAGEHPAKFAITIPAMNTESQADCRFCEIIVTPAA